MEGDPLVDGTNFSELPKEVTLLVAASENGVIGRCGQLPWKLSSDLKRFRQLTMGNALLMGRKTFESIGRPLPGRHTIVLTRQPEWNWEGVSVARSALEGLSLVHPNQSAFVVGGAEIYAQLLPFCDRILLTLVLAQLDGDTYFHVPESGWRLVESTALSKSDRDDFDCIFQTWLRCEKDLLERAK